MQIKLKNLKLRMALIGFCTVAIVFGLTTGSVLAHDDSAEKNLPPHERPAPAGSPAGSSANLAEAATNPIAPMIQFQLQNSYSWENHNSNGYSNVTTIQPVIPIKLPWEKVPMLITRTTLPYVWTPDLGGGIGRVSGFGDLSLLTLFTPKLKTKGVQLGFGSDLSFPTAGDDKLTGSGKWAGGPAFLYINMKTKGIQWGLFAYQNWSFASASGEKDRTDVNKSFIQPFVTYHFGKGWFVGSPESPQQYDYKSKKWSLALGPQLGRVFKIGKQPVKLFGAVYYNPEDNAAATSEWTAKVGLTFLFPE